MISFKQKQIYVVPTWQCNLNCPHCFVHTYNDSFNRSIFMDKLYELKEKYPEATFILHGGEPTLYKERYLELLNTGIINSICSNLVVKTEIIDDLNNRDLSIATSWNPNRFNTFTYLAWLGNIQRLKNTPLVLITLDKDLIQYNMNQFIHVLHDLEERGIEEVLFEPLVDNSLDNSFQEKVDNWLCNIYDIWRSEKLKLKNKIEEQILNWNFNCDSITLLPEGNIRSGCIIGEKCKRVLLKCLKCEYAKVCIPCSLHTRCSFYPKFYEKVKCMK